MSPFRRTANHKNSASDYAFAKEMRHQPTDGEEILWYCLRTASRGQMFRFRRQHPINPYIVDFACLKVRLIVEVDGSSHNTRQQKDALRDEHLKKMGWTIMRFSNNDVVFSRDSVVDSIFNRVQELAGGFDVPLP